MRHRGPVQTTIASLAVIVMALAFASTALGAPKHRTQPVTVMSYNLFQGSELSNTLAINSIAALPAAAAADYQNVIKSNIPARAKAIAAEIKANRPDLVGLQEAVLWRTQSPPPSSSLAIPGTATTVSYDFVSLLVKALARLGVRYRAVAVTNNVDVQANASFSSGQMAVRFTDRVAVLARSGVKVSNVRQQNFTAHDSFNLLGVQIPVPDGYASVDARIGKRTLRFITTHLDGLNTAMAPSVRNAEANEIVNGPAKTSLPVVFTCDCNSTPSSLTYGTLTAAGLRDRWRALNPRRAGLTCCHRSSPTDPEVNVADPHPTQGIVKRYDYVWSTRQFRVLAERTLGLNPADRTKTKPRLWPSDHLGLVAKLML